MGKKKKRQRSPTGSGSGSGSPAKAAKQLRIDEIISRTATTTETVSQPANLVSSNKYAILGTTMDINMDTRQEAPSLPIRGSIQLAQSAQSQVSSPFLSKEVPEGAGLSGLAQPAPDNLGLTSHQLLSLFGEHSIITGKTVLAIFRKLEHISHQLARVQNSLMNSSKESPISHMEYKADHSLSGGGMLAKNSKNKPTIAATIRRLQAAKITLEIKDNYTNRGRWSNRQRVLLSLSKLLRTDVNQIDLKALEYLPRTFHTTRLLLVFDRPIIPLMLLRMGRFLSSFDIAARRVFSDVGLKPLLPPSQVSTLSVAPTPPARLGHSGLLPKPSSADKQASAEGKTAHQISTLPNNLTLCEAESLEKLTTYLEQSLVGISTALRSISTDVMPDEIVGGAHPENTPEASSSPEVFCVPACDFLHTSLTYKANTPWAHSKSLPESVGKDLLLQSDMDGNEVTMEGAVAASNDLLRDKQTKILSSMVNANVKQTYNLEDQIHQTHSPPPLSEVVALQSSLSFPKEPSSSLAEACSLISPNSLPVANEVVNILTDTSDHPVKVCFPQSLTSLAQAVIQQPILETTHTKTPIIALDPRDITPPRAMNQVPTGRVSSVPSTSVSLPPNDI